MTVRTPSKPIAELATKTEELENETNSEADQSDNDEEMENSNESDQADNEFADNESGAEDDDEGNVGWADAFAKVLQQQKPKKKKYLVLSKATKLADKEKREDKPSSFEIADKSGETVEEDVKPDLEDDEFKPNENELELAMLARKESSTKLLQLRVKPGSMDRERERSFKRIATKGVVQLFNAVRSQQRDLVDRLEKAGPLDHKRDEVLNNINKRQFLDMLMGGKRAKSENIDNPVKEEKDAQDDSARPSQWGVLRDDFLTNKKLKHWDKEDDDASGDDAEQNDNMDSDSD